MPQRLLLLGLFLLAGALAYGQCDSLPSVRYTQVRDDSLSAWNDQLRITFIYDQEWRILNSESWIWYEESWHLGSKTDKQYDAAGNQTYYHLTKWDHRQNDLLTYEEKVNYVWEGGEVTETSEEIFRLSDETMTYITRTGSPEAGEVRIEKRIEYPAYTSNSITIITYDGQLREINYFHEGNTKDGTVLGENISRYYNEYGCEEAAASRYYRNDKLSGADSVYWETNAYCDVLLWSDFEFINGLWEPGQSSSFRYERTYDEANRLIHFKEEKFTNQGWTRMSEENYTYDENGYLTYSYTYQPVREKMQDIIYSADYRSIEIFAQIRNPLSGEAFRPDFKLQKDYSIDSLLIHSSRWNYSEEKEQLILVSDITSEYNEDGLMVSSDEYDANTVTDDFSIVHRDYFFGCNNREEGQLYTTINHSDPAQIGHQARLVIDYEDLVTSTERDIPRVKIYPVPANTLITLVLGFAAPAEVVVYDAYGRKIDSFHFRDASIQQIIDVSGYRPGVYLLQINAGSVKTTRRIVVRH